MIKREEIVDGVFVYNHITDNYGYIKDVGNAKKNGFRKNGISPDDELSYTIVDILTNEEQRGICEHSHETCHSLSIVSKTDVDGYLTLLEGESLQKTYEAKINELKVKSARKEFEKTLRLEL